MRKRRFKLWNKVFYGLGLIVFSALTTVALFSAIAYNYNYAANSRVAISAPNKIASKPAPPAAQPRLIDQQLLNVRQLHQSAPAISIEQLMAQNTPNNDVTEPSVFSDASIDPFTPKQYQIKAHSSNYGDRLKRDIKGRPANQSLLIVLHETTSAATGAINTMLTPHKRDQDQVSYHAVIRQDGTIIYTVDPLKRAYGAGDSAFKGKTGLETVQTKKFLAPSVNNFAYHISLETPKDGYDNLHPQHSGYTYAQYESLAWIAARSGVSGDRITTHAAVDQSGERQDPRSFEMASLEQNLALQSAPLISLTSDQANLTKTPDPLSQP